MTLLYTKFIRGLRWNALESILYHCIFLGHQILLFKTIDRQLYGLSSTLIAALYAVVMIANLGLDQTFGPLFSKAKQNKALFTAIVWKQLLVQCALLSAGALLFLYGNIFFVSSKIGSSLTISLICCALILSEGIKKSLRTLLQLAFLNPVTTTVEVATIASYVLLVWGWYFLAGPITLLVLFVPFIITSILSVSTLLAFLYQFYKQVPSTGTILTTEKTALTQRIIKNRFYSALYSTGQQLFSSNILIPTIALHSGLVAAGIFNLIASFSYSLTSIFHKVGGFTTQALLAHIKEGDIHIKRETFAFIIREILHIIAAIIIFLIINYQKILSFNHSFIATDWLVPAYLYLGIILAEYLVIAYEKFYLNEERAEYLVLFYLATIITCSLVLFFSASLSATQLLASLLAIRIVSFVILAIISYRHWGIRPKGSISAWYLIATLIASTLFYFLV